MVNIMHVLSSGTLSFHIREDAGEIRWSAQDLPLRQSPRADFWRAFMDDGYQREITVHSAAQRGTVTPCPGGLDITYDRLTAEGGRIFDVTLTIHIRAVVSTYPAFEMYAQIHNRDAARVNELQLPLLDLDTVCDEQRSSDVLYRMSGLGARIPDPWRSIERCHTEYMAADYNQIWCSDTYPSGASMGWFGVHSAGHFLYIGRQDSRLRTCALAAGVSPRHEAVRLLLAISHFPFAKQGEALDTVRTLVSLNEGDWRTGSDIYGNYARASWYTPPALPEWVRNLSGWQRVILRHQYGEAFFNYADLPRLYQDCAAHGLNTLLVFGWWKGRFDNGYPVYEPDEALGGAQGLRDAIDRIHAMGGRVALYTNGVLIDVASDYYRETGRHICRIDIDGNEYRDHYKFSNDGLLSRTFGYKSFVSACAATPEWHAKLLDHEKLKFSFGCDSAFFDQLGCYPPNPCFNEAHLHGARADCVEEWRRESCRALAENCKGEQAFGTEGVTDMLLPYVQYIHGCQAGAVFTENAFPELFLRTFPEAVQTNRFIHDDKDGFERLMNYAFIYGLRFDISVYRGRKRILGELPRLAAYTKKLTALREKYKRFFYDGRFVVDTPLKLPAHIRMGEYVHGEERMAALWNDSGKIQRFCLAGRTITMLAQEVQCICLN